MDIVDAMPWPKASGGGSNRKRDDKIVEVPPVKAGAGGNPPGPKAPVVGVAHRQGLPAAQEPVNEPAPEVGNPFEDGTAYQMRSINIDIPEDAPITVHNAEKLARIPRYPYKVVALNLERDPKYDGGPGSMRQDENLSKADEKKLQDQWLRSVDIGKGWKPDRILGRGGNGIVGKFDWHGVENDEEADRAWELAVKSICVKQSRRGWSTGLKSEGDRMQELTATGSKHFPRMYNYVKRTRGHSTEGFHIDNAEREVHQMIMEFCAGGDLGNVAEKLYQKGEGLPEYAIWSIFICLAKALKVLRDGTEEPVDDFGLVANEPVAATAPLETNTELLAELMIDDAAPVASHKPPALTFSEILARRTPPGTELAAAAAVAAQPIARMPQQQPKPWKRKIHLDIKPENVFIGSRGVANDLTSHSYAPIHKIADFGMMIHESDVLTAKRRKELLNYGTPTFIPPEQDPKHWKRMKEWAYTTKMNIYNVGCVMWCIMLRIYWPFGDHFHEFGLEALKRENGENVRVRARGASLLFGDRLRLGEGGGTFTVETLANYDYSSDLIVLVQQCLALNLADRPDEDELLRRAIVGFNIARDAHMVHNPHTTVAQMQEEFERLVNGEPVQSSASSSKSKTKVTPPVRPNTPPRMHRSPPPGYWNPVVAEDVRLYHEMNRPRWDKRDAQIIAARKFIRQKPDVVDGDFKHYARDIAINRQIEEKRGCDREDNSADELEMEIPDSSDDSDGTEIDWMALPTSRGPRIRMGFDGIPHEDEWYLPPAKKRRKMTSQQFREAKAKKYEEIMKETKKEKLVPSRPSPQPAPEDPGLEGNVVPQGGRQQQVQSQAAAQPQAEAQSQPGLQSQARAELRTWGADWGGAAHVSAVAAKQSPWQGWPSKDESWQPFSGP